MYIAGSGRLDKFAANGALLNSTMLGSIDPVDVSIDEAGNRLYMAAGTGGLKIFDISGVMPSLIGGVMTPANSEILGVHFADESGNILATDLGFFGSNDPRGLEFSPGGELLREYRPAVRWRR